MSGVHEADEKKHDGRQDVNDQLHSTQRQKTEAFRREEADHGQQRVRDSEDRTGFSAMSCALEAMIKITPMAR